MRRNGWLSYMPEAFQTQLLSNAYLIKFEPGKAVYRYGDPPGGIYGLVAGNLTVNAAAPDSTPRLITLGIPGAWTGEGCFLTGQPRRAEMRALGEAWLFNVPLDALERMAARDPAMIRAIGVSVVSAVDVLIRIVHDLQKRDASRRIASVLQRVTMIGNSPIPLSQSDLGIMANASRQQVNGAMQKFAAAGWLDYTYRSVVVTDAAALSKYAEGDGAD